MKMVLVCLIFVMSFSSVIAKDRFGNGEGGCDKTLHGQDSGGFSIFGKGGGGTDSGDLYIFGGDSGD